MATPKLIYIAGPYRAPTAWQRDENIQNARRWGVEVARCGGYPVIPHSNTAHFDGEADDQLWLEGTLELMRRFNGALFIPRWIDSSGARSEHAEARTIGMPIFNAYDRAMIEIPAWLREIGGAQ